VLWAQSETKQQGNNIISVYAGGMCFSVSLCVHIGQHSSTLVDTVMLLFLLPLYGLEARLIDGVWAAVMGSTWIFSNGWRQIEDLLGLGAFFPLPGILENTTFWKLDPCPSSGEGVGEDIYSVGPLRKT
jgi:hypothetical protein